MSKDISELADDISLVMSEMKISKWLSYLLCSTPISYKHMANLKIHLHLILFIALLTITNSTTSQQTDLAEPWPTQFTDDT